MKKVLILVLLLVFAGAVLSRSAFASEEVAQVDSVNYKLPYPGTLPDSPIYIIKNLRDQAVGLLVLGPINKSFYDLFLSDKRLWAGQMLIENDNDSLGSTTLLISEDYFSSAVDQALFAKKEGLPVSELGAKLLVSSSKHAEVLENVSSQVSGEALMNVNKAIALNEKSRSRVLQLTTAN